MTTILAGQRAAFTKQLNAFHTTEDDDKQRAAVGKMAEIINRAEGKGFTPDQVTQGADIPTDVTALINSSNVVPGPVDTVADDPDLLIRELEQIIDTSEQQIYGDGNQYVYAYGYRCAPDRLKVGRTDRDVIQRIATQINTSTPDKPMLFLVLRTDNCRGLEMALQGVLRVRGRKITGGGDEWFLTTRDELIAIYNTIIGPNDEAA